MSKITTTPWKLDRWGSVVNLSQETVCLSGFALSCGPANFEAKENTRHIVHCVNNHERLVKALDELYREANAFAQAIPPYANSEALIKARALLAALEAEKEGEL